MKTTISVSVFILLLICTQLASAQQKEIVPDLSKVKDNAFWTAHNREVNFNENEVFLNGKAGDGFLKLNGFNFKNGTIELEIKGKDEKGKSFIGIAFHGVNDTTYEAVYFRPFNFQDSERKNHSVQYISHPKFSWRRLREKYPEKYENMAIPSPEPNDWVHVSIVVDYPKVAVFVNNSAKPSLTVDQLSANRNGWIGFWVGNNSEGYFRNLTIIPAEE